MEGLAFVTVMSILTCLLCQVIESTALKLEPPTPVEVLRHQTRTLPCRVSFMETSTDKVNVVWYRLLSGSNHEVRLTVGLASINKKMDVNKVGPNEWNLVIKRIDESDEGVYRCEWSTNWRTETAARYTLIVESPPAVDEATSSPRWVTFHEGETANLTCVMIGRPEPTITWFRHHRAGFSEPEKLGVTGPVLTIPNIQRYAGDEYLCVGENRHKKQGWEIDVKVKFKPHIFVHQHEILARPSSSVFMSCMVESISSVTWHWFNVNGKEINPNFKYDIASPTKIEGYPAEVSTLILRQTLWDERDYGIYKCTATTANHKVHGEVLLKDPKKIG